MSAWQSMETAPRDGTEILVTFDGKSRVVHWDDTGYRHRKHGSFPWVCQSGENAWRENIPTHWMPLPPPPLPGESNARIVAGPAKSETPAHLS